MGKMKGKLVLAIVIFATTGFFARYLTMSLATAAFFCCLIGIAILLAVMKVTKRKLRWRRIKGSFPLAVLSGAALGCSWILLAVAQKNSENTIAMTCYFFVPTLVGFLSPLLYEKYRKGKMTCFVVSFIGLVLTTRFWKNNLVWNWSILLALAAGVLHSGVIICNKYLMEISSYDRTVLQLGTAAVVLVPYCLLSGGFAAIQLDGTGLVALMVLGVLHMGIACRLYFESILTMPLQNIALYSFINPTVVFFISAFMMNEKLGLGEVLGVAMILFSIAATEMGKQNLSVLFQKKG